MCPYIKDTSVAEWLNDFTCTHTHRVRMEYGLGGLHTLLGQAHRTSQLRSTSTARAVQCAGGICTCPRHQRVHSTRRRSANPESFSGIIPPMRCLCRRGTLYCTPWTQCGLHEPISWCQYGVRVLGMLYLGVLAGPSISQQRHRSVTASSQPDTRTEHTSPQSHACGMTARYT